MLFFLIVVKEVLPRAVDPARKELLEEFDYRQPGLDLLDGGVVLGEDDQVVVPHIRNILDGCLNLPHAKALADVGLADAGGEARLHAGQINAGHRVLSLLLFWQILVQFRLLADHIAAIKDDVLLLNIRTLKIYDVDVFLRDVLALHPEERERAQRPKLLGLILVDVPQVGSVMLEKLGLEKQFSACIFVFELEFEFWLHVYLAVHVDYVVE